VLERPINRFLPTKKSILLTPFFLSSSDPARLQRLSYVAFTICFASCEGSDVNSVGVTDRRKARYSVLKTSETVTNAPGLDEEATTMIDQGRWWEIIVREGSGGFEAGSESARGERGWLCCVLMDDGCKARLNLMSGLCEKPR
jgi:hypothetical protein